MKLSEHFTTDELNCKCGCGQTVLPELVAALEKLRAEYGKPIVVSSGRRCVSHNRAVGGARQSRHVLGEAADCHVPAENLLELYRAAIWVPEIRGIGIYPGRFIHVDIRPKLARWGKDGKASSFERCLKEIGG